jgi:hypothetical protein
MQTRDVLLRPRLQSFDRYLLVFGINELTFDCFNHFSSSTTTGVVRQVWMQCFARKNHQLIVVSAFLLAASFHKARKVIVYGEKLFLRN